MQREISEAAGKTDRVFTDALKGRKLSRALRKPDRTFKAFLNPLIERGEGENLPIESFELDDEKHRVKKVVDSGYHCTVYVCKKFAFKFYKREPASSAVEESKNLRKILSVVNPTDREIGIMPWPVSFFGERECVLYTPTGDEWDETEVCNMPVQIEKTFSCDLLNAVKNRIIQEKEIPLLAACLVNGSKKLQNNDFHHLDVTLSNIAYEQGKLFHFDIGGSYNGNEENWLQKRVPFTPYYVPKKEADELKNLRSRVRPFERDAEAKKKLKGLHMFQVGIALYAMATRSYPYKKDKKDDYPIIPDNKDGLREKELEGAKVYNPRQIDMVMRMLDASNTERPDVSEAAGVFPLPQKETPLTRQVQNLQRTARRKTWPLRVGM